LPVNDTPSFGARAPVISQAAQKEELRNAKLLDVVVAAKKIKLSIRMCVAAASRRRAPSPRPAGGIARPLALRRARETRRRRLPLDDASARRDRLTPFSRRCHPRRSLSLPRAPDAPDATRLAAHDRTRRSAGASRC
jgi:hypothetical protein